MDKEKINKICKKYNITDYTINKDGSINVIGDVDLSGKKLKKLPLKFERVAGNFNCSDNYLENLIWSPRKIVKNETHKNKSGNFNCGHNNLKSLEHGPKTVSGEYIASSNYITDFFGFPENYKNENHVNFACNPVFEILDLVIPEQQAKFINCINQHDSIIKKGNILFEIGLDQAYYETTKEELAFERKKFRNYTLI